MTPTNSDLRTAEAFLSRKEAQKVLKISGATFYRYISQGRLQAIKVGCKTCVRESEIRRFFDACPALPSRIAAPVVNHSTN